MSSIRVSKIDLGVLNGLQTWEVRNADTGEIIGYDQAASEDLATDA